MKISKKVLSVVLALAMVFSVCALSVSAALSAGQYGIKVETTAGIGQTSGTVDVTFKYQFPEGFDVASYMMQAGSNTTFCYNAAKYEYVGYEWLVVASDGTPVFKPNAPTSSDALFTNVSGKFTANDKTLAEKAGWNKVALIASAFDNNAQKEYTATTGAPLVADDDNEAAYLKVTFNVLGKLTADDIIGIPEATVTQLKNTKMMYRNGTANTTVAPANIVLADPATPAPISYVATQGQPVAEEGKWNLGIKAMIGVADDAFFDFDEKGHSKAIESVGAEVTINGKTESKTERFVYDIDGVYQYRVVLAGIDTSASEDVTIKFFYVTAGDEPKTVYGQTVTINLADAYAECSARFPA